MPHGTPWEYYMDHVMMVAARVDAIGTFDESFIFDRISSGCLPTFGDSLCFPSDCDLWFELSAVVETVDDGRSIAYMAVDSYLSGLRFMIYTPKYGVNGTILIPEHWREPIEQCVIEYTKTMLTK